MKSISFNEYLIEDDLITMLEDIAENFDMSYDEVEEIYLSLDEGILNKIAVGATIIAGITATLLGTTLWASWRTVEAAFSKAKRKCGVFTIGKKRERCIAEVKSQMLNEKIKILNKSKKQCPQKAKEDRKLTIKRCKEMFKKAVEQLKLEIKILNVRKGDKK